MRRVAMVSLGALAALSLVERLRPLRPRAHSLRARGSVNLALATTAAVVVTFVVAPGLVTLAELSRRQRIGVLPRLSLPRALQSALSFVLLDFFTYVWHRLNHQLPQLWRAHRVHHADPELDVQTALRFHPLELLASLAGRGFPLLLLGPRRPDLQRYDAAMLVATLFHHSNLRLPEALEKALGKLIIVPRLHVVHHSTEPREQHSNFGVVFSVWDRLLRTSLEMTTPVREVGLAGHPRAAPLSPRRMLALPFTRERFDATEG